MTFTPGQQRVINAALENLATLQQAADRLKVSLGTVKRQTQRAKARDPEGYAAYQARRSALLAERHDAAMKRRRRHSNRWFSKQRRLAKEGNVRAEYKKGRFALQPESITE